ncbi:hypothetical protein D3C84_443270 [compost metagenome]
MLLGLGADEQAAVVGDQVGQMFRRVVRTDPADLQIAGNTPAQVEQAMAFLHGAAQVAHQDAQLAFRIADQESGAGLLDGAVVVEPGFQVGAVQAEAATCLLHQCQGVGAGVFGCAETLEPVVGAEDEGGGLPVRRFGLGGGRVVHAEAPRRLEFDGRQFDFVLSGFRGVFLHVCLYWLSRNMSTWGMPASRNSLLTILKPWRS